jgi:VanZ family protein
MFILSLAVIFAVTLFPYRFSFNEYQNLMNSFQLARALESRGADLLIGVDGAFHQPFRGTIDEVRIYRRAVTAAEIAREAELEQYESTSQAGLAPPDPASKDLVASYSFDENSGTAVKDGSGNGNDGLLVNYPQRVSGRRGKALSFDGSGQYVRVPNSPMIDVSGRAITISMWIMLRDFTNASLDQVLLSKPWNTNSMKYPYYQYAVEFDANGKKSVDFFFGDDSGRLRGPFSMTAPLGVWTHVAFVYDGSHVRGYVDGREELATGISEEWNFPDIFDNILLFMPFGYGLAAAIRRKGFSTHMTILCTFAIGLLLSLGVETLQVWLPGRWPSLVDVASNGIGALLGSIVLLTWNRLRSRSHLSVAVQCLFLLTRLP